MTGNNPIPNPLIEKAVYAWLDTQPELSGWMLQAATTHGTAVLGKGSTLKKKHCIATVRWIGFALGTEEPEGVNLFYQWIHDVLAAVPADHQADAADALVHDILTRLLQTGDPFPGTSRRG